MLCSENILASPEKDNIYEIRETAISLCLGGLLSNSGEKTPVSGLAEAG